VGTGVDLTIRELAEAVAVATGFEGEILWDATKPDGTPKKQLGQIFATAISEDGSTIALGAAKGNIYIRLDFICILK
jgi:hypothetical protein